MKRSAFALTLIVIAASSVAHAQSSNLYNRAGAYLQFGGAATFEDFDLPTSIDVDEGFTIDPAVGYRLNSVIALEIQGRYLDEMDIHAFGSSLEVDGWSIFFNGKLFAPVDWRVQPFVKFGAGYTEIELESVDSDGAGLNFGAGAEYYIDESVAIGVEGGRFQGVDDLDDFDYWTGGAFLKFMY